MTASVSSSLQWYPTQVSQQLLLVFLEGQEAKSSHETSEGLPDPFRFFHRIARGHRLMTKTPTFQFPILLLLPGQAEVGSMAQEADLPSKRAWKGLARGVAELHRNALTPLPYPVQDRVDRVSLGGEQKQIRSYTQEAETDRLTLTTPTPATHTQERDRERLAISS